MKIEIEKGVRLFVDVEGPQLVPHGSAMREKPTLICMHGGPGFDHSSFKPAFSRLAARECFRLSMGLRVLIIGELQSNDTRNLQRDIVGTAVFLGQPDQRLTGIGWRLRTEHILHFSFRQLPP